MTALDKMLVRDLGHLRGQVITIALVVACGIASFVTMRSAYESLVASKDAYYERYRLADVFAHLERAPLSELERLARIPGVSAARARVLETVMVPLPNMARPASGTIVSLAKDRSSSLEDLYLRAGRLPRADHASEVLVLEAFAEAHGLTPGDRLPAVINGTLEELTIAGLAMSPEFVMALPLGGFSYDPKQVVVLWMPRETVDAAFRMEGAFNDVLIELQPGASEVAVIEHLDRELAPYGGRGARPRSKQASNYVLEGEIQQLGQMAEFVPFIFLFVAAFLLNVVLSRLTHLQRLQVATLKAIGYSDRSVGLHYLKLVSVIVVLGATLGTALGAWLGNAMTDMYTSQYFRFPDPVYRLDLRIVAVAVGLSLASAAVGALAAVRQLAALPPAEAMRPAAPASYEKSPLDWLGALRWLGPASRMVWREVQRRPARLLLSSVAIALGVGLVVVSGFWMDGIRHIMDTQFNRAMREDVTIVFSKPLDSRAVRELSRLPGVVRAEGLRTMPVRLRSGQHVRDSAIIGYGRESELRRILDARGVEAAVPLDGLLLQEKLAEILDVRVGDSLEIELREGDRGVRFVPVKGLVNEAFGLQSYMPEALLHRLARETDVVDTALLRVDPHAIDGVHRRAKKLPWVAAISSPKDFQEQFDEQSAAIVKTFTLVLVAFASIISVGVIYNNARVALSQRSRELASLRVLGFTRREIAAVLFGELGIQLLIGVPLGFFIGHWLAQALASTTDPETYRLSVVLSKRTYALAATVSLASALAAALLVRRKIDQLDLIGVLKTRE